MCNRLMARPAKFFDIPFRERIKVPSICSLNKHWVFDRQLRQYSRCSGSGSFGGADRTYEITVDPVKLAKYNITPLEVYSAVSKSNINVGGDVIEKNATGLCGKGHWPA